MHQASKAFRRKQGDVSVPDTILAPQTPIFPAVRTAITHPKLPRPPPDALRGGRAPFPQIQPAPPARDSLPNSGHSPRARRTTVAAPLTSSLRDPFPASSQHPAPSRAPSHPCPSHFLYLARAPGAPRWCRPRSSGWSSQGGTVSRGGWALWETPLPLELAPSGEGTGLPPSCFRGRYEAPRPPPTLRALTRALTRVPLLLPVCPLPFGLPDW